MTGGERARAQLSAQNATVRLARRWRALCAERVAAIEERFEHVEAENDDVERVVLFGLCGFCAGPCGAGDEGL
jgi:hypothetical protein